MKMLNPTPEDGSDRAETYVGFNIFIYVSEKFLVYSI
jgi:hypothetical protein